MRKRNLCTLAMSFVMALCIACTFGFALAEPSETVYEAEKVFSAVSAPLSYREDGSIQVGDGDGTNDQQLWTNPGEYAFSSQPFSVTFRLNGLPPEDQKVRKDSYFFLNEKGSDKTIWFNFLVYGGDVNGRAARLNINIKDMTDSIMVDNFLLDFDFSAADVSITLTYDSANKKASVAFGEYFHEFDLTKDANGGEFAKVNELPTGDIQLALMNTRGGVIVEQINGQSFHYTVPDTGFETVPNFDDDIMTNDENTAEIEYLDEGVHVSNGNPASDAMAVASVNPKYKFENVIDAVIRFDAVQPAAADSRKNVYFVFHNDQDTSVQLKVKFFLYCTSNDAEAAQYILHADVFVGDEGTENITYFAQSKNFLWDFKNVADVPLRVKYDAEAKQVRVFQGTSQVDIDLTKDRNGEPVTVTLPSGEMHMQTLVQYGGYYLESLNQHQLKFNRSDYEVAYTDKTDFFTEESEARVAYRNGGILISNNDKTSVNYLTAAGNEAYVYDTGNMIFEYKFDGLQVYDPTVPLSVMKAVWFDISDDQGRTIGLQPFLYQAGNSRILHINVLYCGKNIYENHSIGYDFVDYENVVMYLKYNGNDHTLELGSTTAKTTLDLSQSYNGTISQGAVDTSNMPSGNLKLDSVRVQFGGIYLQRINQYSFVVENPETPDPVDPEIKDFGLADSTFDKDIEIAPVIDYGGYPEAEFKLSYQLPEGEEYLELSADEGVYAFSFGDYGVYRFKYELLFDGITITAIRTCEYRSSSFETMDALYTTNNGTFTVVDEGLQFTSSNPANNVMGYGVGKFEVSGKTTVKLDIVELQAPATRATPVYKSMWIDFTDNKNGVWVDVFAFSAPGTNGRYPAYASVSTFKNGDKGTQMKVQDNVPLNFNFDLSDGSLDPSAIVEIVYEPGEKRVSVGKAGENLTSFDLFGKDLPTGKFQINTGFNYGSMIVTEIDGFSFANEDGKFEFPAPMIAEDSIPTYLVIGDKLMIPKDVVFDIFDLKPQLTVLLEDEAGESIALAEETVDGREVWSVTLSELGSYTLTLTAKNAKDLTTEKTVTVQVIPEDLEAPEMTFAEDAFSAFKQGDRDYKFEVRKDTVIELPTPTLTDDSGLPVQLKVSVTDPKGNISLVNGMKFTGDTIGTYRVEYLATDVFGKETSLIVQFVVKLNWTEEEDPGDETPAGGCNCGGSAAAGALGGALVLLAAATVPLAFKRKHRS